MKLNQINNISFNGKIIDMHTHIGHWDNNKYFGKEALDTFTQTPIAVNINGIKSEDTIEKMIISSLDSIGTNGASGRSNEIEGLNQVLNLTKNNEKYSVMAVCQPNLTNGDASALREALNNNSTNIVGLKFHPRKLLEGQIQDNPAWYDDYFKLAQEKNLPCLFHCDEGISGANKIYNLVKGKYSQIPVILGHCGAGGDANFNEALNVLKSSIDNNDAKIYADISWLDWKNDLPDGNHLKVKQLITELKERNALDRILFGTDAPLGCFGENPVGEITPKTAYEKTVSGLKTMIKRSFGEEADDIIEKIFYKNSKELFYKNNSNITGTNKTKNKFITIVIASAIALGAIGTWVYHNKDFLAKFFKK